MLGFKSSALARDAFGYSLCTRHYFVEVFGHDGLQATDLGGVFVSFIHFTASVCLDSPLFGNVLMA